MSGDHNMYCSANNPKGEWTDLPTLQDVALATVLNEVVNLRDRMGGSEGLHRINAHKIKFLKDQLAAAQAQIKVLRDALENVEGALDESGMYQHYPVTYDLFIEALATPTDDSALREMLATQEQDLFTCPNCGGDADNGFSREIPPSPYWCTTCMEQTK